MNNNVSGFIRIIYRVEERGGEKGGEGNFCLGQVGQD